MIGHQMSLGAGSGRKVASTRSVELTVESVSKRSNMLMNSRLPRQPGLDRRAQTIISSPPKSRLRASGDYRMEGVSMSGIRALGYMGVESPNYRFWEAIGPSVFSMQ